ncbi:hypothetical protein HPP92_004810 [Vanilla planifolia]|uniref:AAA+ ATPase domain-containing protein n=1 Tax=Vanilla planifolia TaxID=51239 RepID=A0A835RS78_VANPL|nr:hypothetical protein HPP92_004810 [Vanilla planifolia]
MCVNLQIDPVRAIIELFTALSEPLRYLRNPKPRLALLTDAMSQIKSKREDYNDKIHTAELAGQTSTHQIMDWLNKVAAVDSKVAKIQTDFLQQRSCRWCINRRVAKSLATIKDLIDAASKIDHVATKLAPKGVQEVSDVPPASVNKTTYLSQLQVYIQDDECRIIGIWGMGGVGKTTLLQSLNNELLSSAEADHSPQQFDHVIWAVASKDYRQGKLQRDIARRLGLPLRKDRVRQAKEIFDFLKNKNFLLLLDDLWQPVDFAAIGIPQSLRYAAAGGNATKHKVVFTTRLEGVCGQMQARRKIKLECLNVEDAWRLFQEKVGEETLRAHARIPQLARRVAKECDGLPLALVVIGTAMSTKKTPKEWQNAITLLQKSRPYEIHGMDDKILPKLKFSYDNLADDTIRECFLLCSLWPEDFSISKTDLIECWMGHGLVGEGKLENINEAYDSGHALIGGLKAACLLESGDDGEREVKMHDVVRDLAVWIASDCGEKHNRFIVQTGEVGAEYAQSEVERISLVESDLSDTSGLQNNCSKLETLMLQWNFSFRSICTGFCDRALALTYLDLSHNTVKDLPPEIGRLGNLRYLNVSDTQIRSLPWQIGCLSELRFLLLRSLDSVVIPSGVITKLVKLSVIDMTDTWCESWLELSELRGCLKGVGLVLEVVEDLKQLARLSNVPTWRLGIRKLVGLAEPLQLLSPLQLGSRSIRSSIQSLKIEFCESLELVTMEGDRGIGSSSSWCLPRLEVVELYLLPKLKEIVWRGVIPADSLPSLTVLKIYNCRKLTNISWVLRLPSLEVLTMAFCDEMQEVIDEDQGGDAEENGVTNETFPSLKNLCLINLRSLRMFSGGSCTFPSLEVLTVRGCPEMKKLPFGAEMADKRLKEIWGDRAWWDALQMENEARAALQPRFKRREPR